VTPGSHRASAGPHHGPAHAGDRASAEPGGFDEFDHPVSEPMGTPVVSDGIAPEGDSTEPTLPGDGCEAAATEVTDPAYPAGSAAADSPDAALAAERLEDLRRLQAEYVNYKKRVDRDRSLAREAGISHVLESMFPVLDEIHLAREHGDLVDGPGAVIVDKLEAVLAKLGIEAFGDYGDEFDPMHHEALMHIAAEVPADATSTTVVKVLQRGYRLGDRVVRPARVAVADPE
jgi:molecular chaperone GrpE